MFLVCDGCVSEEVVSICGIIDVCDLGVYIFVMWVIEWSIIVKFNDEIE